MRLEGNCEMQESSNFEIPLPAFEIREQTVTVIAHTP